MIFTICKNSAANINNNTGKIQVSGKEYYQNSGQGIALIFLLAPPMVKEVNS